MRPDSTCFLIWGFKFYEGNFSNSTMRGHGINDIGTFKILIFLFQNLVIKIPPYLFRVQLGQSKQQFAHCISALEASDSAVNTIS